MEGHLPTGTVVDHYRVVRKLGEGGFSEAYEAVDQRDDRRVVLKCPNETMLADRETFERFRREAAIARRLDHPNIQRSLDHGDNRSHPYLVFEYVPGRSLRDVTYSRLPLPTDQAADYGRQLARALVHAHQQGVAHRDLKPENVLVADDGRLLLTDFGTALLEGARRVTWTAASASLGTPDYMAPEQIEGKRGDERTDVYSLGVVLYELLTGRVPFAGDNALSSMQQTLTATPDPLRKRNRAVPAALDVVVRKAINRDPARRYQHASELLADLEGLDAVDVDGLERAQTRRAGSWWRRLRW